MNNNLDEIRTIEDSFLKELFFYDYARGQRKSLNEIEKNVLQEEYCKIRNNNMNCIDRTEGYANANVQKKKILKELRKKEFQKTRKKHDIKITCNKINGAGYINSYRRKLHKKFKEQQQSIYNELNITAKQVIQIQYLYYPAISLNEATYTIHYVL